MSDPATIATIAKVVGGAAAAKSAFDPETGQTQQTQFISTRKLPV